MSVRVTAIVAAYNEQRHIGQCLESLLRQTYEPLEILVADDGSRDGTVEAARRFPSVRILRLPHQGKARTLNHAAQEAGGEILLFLDADLRFSPDYVTRLVEPILAGTAVGASHATETVANPDNVWARCLQAMHGLPPGLRMNLTDAQVAEGTTVYRAIPKDLFLRVGGFSDTGYLDDQSLFPKVGQRGVFVPAAACEHHNPDRLRDVFAAGVWAGKSVHLLHGARALLSRSPISALVRGLTEAVRHRLPALALYHVVYGTGVWWGAVKRAVGLDRNLGA